MARTRASPRRRRIVPCNRWIRWRTEAVNRALYTVCIARSGRWPISERACIPLTPMLSACRAGRAAREERGAPAYEAPALRLETLPGRRNPQALTREQPSKARVAEAWLDDDP